MLVSLAFGLAAAVSVTIPTFEVIAMPVSAGEDTATIEELTPSQPADALAPISASSTAVLRMDTGEVIVTWTPKVIDSVQTDPSAANTTTAKGDTTSNFVFGVWLVGHQAAIDTCKGFVWEDFGSNGNVVSAHRDCGGAVILTLRVGDTVRLKGHGAGNYHVVFIKNVPKGTSTATLHGELWMQTCTYGASKLHLVELAPSN